MRLLLLAIMAALLTAVQPAGAQQRDGNGIVTMSTRTAQPVRVAYRAGIDVLMRARSTIRAMSLDNTLITGDVGLDGRPARSMVRMVFEARGDSTQVDVAAIIPDSAGRDICCC